MKIHFAVRFHVLVLLAGVWAAITGFLIWDYRQEVEAAEHQSATLSQSLASHAEQVLVDAERLGRIIENTVRAQGISASLDPFMSGQRPGEQLILQLSLVDNEGWLQSSTTSGFQKIDLSDREHIKAHLQDNHPGMFVSKPLVGRASKRLSLQLSQALRNTEGGLLGVLVISIDPNLLTDRYRKLDLGESSMIALVGTQDKVIRLVRSNIPIPGVVPGERAPGLLLMANAVSASLTADNNLLTTSSTPAQTADSDQLKKLDLMLASAEVNHYPLAVIVGLSKKDLLSHHYLRRAVLLGATALITLLTLWAELRHTRLIKRARESDQQLSKALHQVLSRERRLAALFRAIPDPAIAFSGEDQRVSGFNLPMAKLMNVQESDMESISLTTFAHDVFANDVSHERASKIKQFSEKLKHALSADHISDPTWFEIQIDTPAPLIFEVRIEPMPNEPAGILVLLRDVTARQRLERMTNDFAATAAHELRTPLASIIGFSELMAAGLIPDHEKQKIAGQIYSRAKGMAELVNDLLTLTRLETGRGGGQLKEMDLRDIIQPLLDSVPEAVPTLEITLPDQPVRINGNLSELVAALRNAIENALKYGDPEKGITLRLWTDTQHQHARMLVADHGPGVSDADINRIFKRFVRLNPTNTVDGSGLGLPLVRGVLQHHKGWAWAESRPGEGFQLHMSIPLKSGPHAPTPTTG